MLNPKYFFNLESRQQKNGKRLIFFNLSYGYKQISKNGALKYMPMRMSVRKSIETKYWDSENQKANKEYVRKYGATLNNWLDKIRIEGIETLDIIFVQNRIKPDPNYLKSKLEIKLGLSKVPPVENVSIINFISNKINERSQLPFNNKKYWSAGTVKSYNNLINLLELYQKKSKKILFFETLNDDIYWDFFNVINEIYFIENKEYYTVTNMAKICKNLKAIMKSAEDEDIEVGLKYSNSKYKIFERKPSHETYLDEGQISKIIDFKSDDNDLMSIKKFTIIALFTALRFDDLIHLYQLNDDDFIERDGIKYFITKVRKSRENKEELLVAIPIFKEVEHILIANNNRFPTFPPANILREKFKKLMKTLEFNNKIVIKTHYYGFKEPIITNKCQHELLTPHDCRRSFITNIKKAGVMSETIENISHPKVKAKNIIDVYDKSTILDKSERFVNELKNCKSMVYKWI